MSGHTPGPWSVSWDCNGVGYVGVGPNCTIAKVMCPPSGDQSANARLIAAAPELLDALRRAVCALATSELFHDEYEAVSRAIAKATGQPAGEGEK